MGRDVATYLGVATWTHAGSTCSACAANGTGETTYSYVTSGFAEGYNSWATETIEHLPGWV